MSRLTILLSAILLSSCASCGHTGLKRVEAVAQCVVDDDILGVVIHDPAKAHEWLKQTRKQMQEIIQRWIAAKTIPGDLSQEYALLEQLLTLVTRLERCLSVGSDKEAVHAALGSMQSALAKQGEIPGLGVYPSSI